MKTAVLENVSVESIRTKRRRRRHSKIPSVFDSTQRTRHWVFQNATLSIAPGDCVFLLDPDGDRSSTLMKVLTGLVPPDEGSAVRRGRGLMLTPPSRRWLRSLSLGQSARLLGGMYGMTDQEIDERFEHWMEFAGLADKSWKPVEEVRRKVIWQLAFAVGTSAPVKLLGLDHMAVVGNNDFQPRCIPRIREMTDSGVALVVVDSSPSLIPQLATRAIRVKRKKLVEMPVLEAEELARKWARSKRQDKRRRKEIIDEDENEDFI